MDLRHKAMPAATATLGMPVTDRQGEWLGTVDAVIDDAVPGRKTKLEILYVDDGGGVTPLTFPLSRFACRRNAQGDYLELNVDADELGGRSDAGEAAHRPSTVGSPARRRMPVSRVGAYGRHDERRPLRLR